MLQAVENADLQVPFSRGRALAEYIQNKGCPVAQTDAIPQNLLQTPLLTRGQLIVKDDCLDAEVGYGCLNLCCFAAADVCPRVGLLQSLKRPPDNLVQEPAQMLGCGSCK